MMNFKSIQKVHKEALTRPVEKDQRFCRFEYVKAIYEQYLEHLIDADYRYEIIYAANRYRNYDTETQALMAKPKKKDEFTLMNKCTYSRPIDMESGYLVTLQSDSLDYMSSYCSVLQMYLGDLKRLMYHPSIYKDEKRLYDIATVDGKPVKQHYKFSFVAGKLYKIYYELRMIKGKQEELYSGVREASNL
jgi:hypothetical protein